MIDTDNSGQITFEELKVGLKKVGANLKESEIYDLMQAVSIFIRTCYTFRKKQVVFVR
jgi:calcium-dependent protein kinase